MPRDPHHPFAQEPRDTSQLVDAALAAPDSDSAWEAIAILHYRGSDAEFAAARRLAKGDDAKARELAADILGQLGWGDRTFLEESVGILIDLLRDTEPSVVAAAATALGHRLHPAAIPHLLARLDDRDADVRLGIVHGLSGHDEPSAALGLVRLSADSDRDVRDWATFGLASQTSLDSPEIRAALFSRTSDDDAEIRGEALIGLARRHDPRTLDLLVLELRHPLAGDWPLEAAELIAHPSLLPLLERAWRSLNAEDRIRFARRYEVAVAACQVGR